MSTAPKGFRFATACAGFRKEGRADLALLVSDVPAVAAGTFTQNRFPAAPVLVAKAMLAERPAARAVVINSGQANACTGDEGMRNCRTTQELVAGALGLEASDILPASTGVIGAQLKMDLWEKAAPALAANLGKATHVFQHSILAIGRTGPHDQQFARIFSSKNGSNRLVKLALFLCHRGR